MDTIRNTRHNRISFSGAGASDGKVLLLQGPSVMRLLPFALIFSGCCGTTTTATTESSSFSDNRDYDDDIENNGNRSNYFELLMKPCFGDIGPAGNQDQPDLLFTLFCGDKWQEVDDRWTQVWQADEHKRADEDPPVSFNDTRLSLYGPVSSNWPLVPGRNSNRTQQQYTAWTELLGDAVVESTKEECNAQFPDGQTLYNVLTLLQQRTTATVKGATVFHSGQVSRFEIRSSRFGMLVASAWNGAMKWCFEMGALPHHNSSIAHRINTTANDGSNTVANQQQQQQDDLSVWGWSRTVSNPILRGMQRVSPLYGEPGECRPANSGTEEPPNNENDSFEFIFAHQNVEGESGGRKYMCSTATELQQFFNQSTVPEIGYINMTQLPGSPPAVYHDPQNTNVLLTRFVVNFVGETSDVYTTSVRQNMNNPRFLARMRARAVAPASSIITTSTNSPNSDGGPGSGGAGGIATKTLVIIATIVVSVCCLGGVLVWCTVTKQYKRFGGSGSTSTNNQAEPWIYSGRGGPRHGLSEYHHQQQLNQEMRGVVFNNNPSNSNFAFTHQHQQNQNAHNIQFQDTNNEGTGQQRRIFYAGDSAGGNTTSTSQLDAMYNSYGYLINSVGGAAEIVPPAPDPTPKTLRFSSANQAQILQDILTHSRINPPVKKFCAKYVLKFLDSSDSPPGLSERYQIELDKPGQKALIATLGAHTREEIMEATAKKLSSSSTSATTSSLHKSSAPSTSYAPLPVNQMNPASSLPPRNRKTVAVDDTVTVDRRTAVASSAAAALPLVDNKEEGERGAAAQRTNQRQAVQSAVLLHQEQQQEQLVQEETETQMSSTTRHNILAKDNILEHKNILVGGTMYDDVTLNNHTEETSSKAHQQHSNSNSNIININSNDQSKSNSRISSGSLEGGGLGVSNSSGEQGSGSGSGSSAYCSQDRTTATSSAASGIITGGGNNRNSSGDGRPAPPPAAPTTRTAVSADPTSPTQAARTHKAVFAAGPSPRGAGGCAGHNTFDAVTATAHNETEGDSHGTKQPAATTTFPTTSPRPSIPLVPLRTNTPPRTSIAASSDMVQSVSHEPQSESMDVDGPPAFASSSSSSSDDDKDNVKEKYYGKFSVAGVSLLPQTVLVRDRLTSPPADGERDEEREKEGVPEATESIPRFLPKCEDFGGDESGGAGSRVNDDPDHGADNRSDDDEDLLSLSLTSELDEVEEMQKKKQQQQYNQPLFSNNSSSTGSGSISNSSIVPSAGQSQHSSNSISTGGGGSSRRKRGGGKQEQKGHKASSASASASSYSAAASASTPTATNKSSASIDRNSKATTHSNASIAATAAITRVYSSKAAPPLASGAWADAVEVENEVESILSDILTHSRIHPPVKRNVVQKYVARFLRSEDAPPGLEARFDALSEQEKKNVYKALM